MRLPRIAFPIVVLLASCSRPDWAIPEGLTTDRAMLEAIRTIVPPGTSIAEAQDRLHRSGFDCVYQWHGMWGTEQDVNYLYCHREEGTWIAERAWEVAVMMDGTTVGDVRVATGLLGPA